MLKQNRKLLLAEYHIPCDLGLDFIRHFKQDFVNVCIFQNGKRTNSKLFVIAATIKSIFSNCILRNADEF